LLDVGKQQPDFLKMDDSDDVPAAVSDGRAQLASLKAPLASIGGAGTKQ